MSGAPQLMSCVLVALAITGSLYQVVEGINISSERSIGTLNYRGSMTNGEGEGPTPDSSDTAGLERLCCDAQATGYSGNCRVITLDGRPRNAIICSGNVALVPQSDGSYIKISFSSIVMLSAVVRS